jgi:hypothetical protein
MFHSDPESRARPALSGPRTHLAGLSACTPVPSNRLTGPSVVRDMKVSGETPPRPPQPKYTPAERICGSCGRPYRGNNRAKAQLCPTCRAVKCVTCSKNKSPGDKTHSECTACRAIGKVCATCGVNPTFQNRRECWDCLAADGAYATQARDRLYNLSAGWYEQQLAEQGDVCEISGQPETSVSKRTGNAYPLAVDHDRSCCPGPSSCGKCLRGLIRRNLNVALGMFGDDPALLRAAADYIEKHRKLLHGAPGLRDAPARR